MSNLKKAYKTIVEDNFPEEMTISFGKQKLIYKKRTWKIDEDGTLVERGIRYGENPGQQAALYELVCGNLTLGETQFINPENGLVSALDESMLLQFGKHPGKINLTDIDAALNIIKYLMDRPAAAVMKHNNPSGVARGSNAADAIEKAFMTDRLAAMGGCIAVNRPIDKAAAEFIAQNYVEVVVAPSYEQGALELLKTRKNLRIVQIPKIDVLADYRAKTFLDFKSLIDGGIIVQSSMSSKIEKSSDFILPSIKMKSGEVKKCDRTPCEAEYDDLIFGWNIELGVTSNSVLFVKDGVTVAIGTGEQDRVGCAQIAAQKAYTKLADRLAFEKYKKPYNDIMLAIAKKQMDQDALCEIDEQTQEAKGGLLGSVMISDGFFPFRDGLDVGIEQGITAVAQPGGSMRDAEVIEACNEADPKVAMVFTGQRAFKH